MYGYQLLKILSKRKANTFIPTILFVSRQLQVRLSAIKFYCQRAREDFSLVFLREIARPCERLEILREKLRGHDAKIL